MVLYEVEPRAIRHNRDNKHTAIAAEAADHAGAAVAVGPARSTIHGAKAAISAAAVVAVGPARSTIHGAKAAIDAAALVGTSETASSTLQPSRSTAPRSTRHVAVVALVVDRIVEAQPLAACSL